MSQESTPTEDGNLLQTIGTGDTGIRELRPGYSFLGSITRGWFTSGPRSEWSRRVTQGRTVNQDRIRPFATRGALLIVLAACLVAIGATGWALLWLALGAIQTILEIVAEPTMRAKHEMLAQQTKPAESWFGRFIVHVWYWNYERGITNVTGLLGAVAAVGNIVFVLYGTSSTADPAWVRVLALGVVMLYLASGALGPLADTSMYSPATALPRWLTAALRWLWVGVAAVIVARMWAGEGTATGWGPALPYAAMAVVGISYYPMLRCREYERGMAAAEDVAEDLAKERYASVALELHNLLQPVKQTLEIAAQSVPNPADRAQLQHYLRDMKYIHLAASNRTIDLSQGLGMPLEDHLKSLGSAERVKLRVDLQLPPNLKSEHALHAKQWLLVLVHNSVQAYRLWDGDGLPTVTVTAAAKDQDVVLEVSDLLGLLPGSVWDNPETTLRKVRGDVEALGGSMTQTASIPEGKTITIRWRAIDSLRGRVERKDRE